MKPLVVILWFVYFAGRVCAGVTIIDEPSGAQFNEGNSVNSVPFHTGWPIRYQQVYNASGFTPLLPFGGGYIDYMWFRPDSVLGDTFGATFGNVQFRLSTTSRSADNLSLVYQENIGPDEMTTFGPGELFWFDTVSPNDVIEAFSTIQLTLPTPFFYNPSAGNLLLDVTILEGAPTTFFDAQDGLGDGLSSVWGSIGESASNADSLGLVTRFQFTVIPEPQPIVLLLTGLVTMVIGTWGCRFKFQ